MRMETLKLILSFGLFLAALSNAVAINTRAIPPVFTANPSVGPGGRSFKDSAHFRVYDAPEGQAQPTLNMLEAAYECFVEKLEWRSSGLSLYSYGNATAEASGQFYKENIYAVTNLGNAAGVMGSDMKQGLSFVKVLQRSVADPRVTVHEFGHALTYHERNWVEQSRTGAWWEPLAEWFADTYMTSPLCKESRAKGGPSNVATTMDIPHVLNNAHKVIVDGTKGSGNYYQSWPFLSYLTYNPDNIAGLGKDVVRDMIRKYQRGTNQTPLHSLERVALGTKASKIVGKYWARMAYVDIGHKAGKKKFDTVKSRINYSNLVSQGEGVWKVKDAKAPKYMGANIIPLSTTGGQVTIKVTASMGFTATLALRDRGGNVRYVELPNGSGTASIAGGEEASLVVVNTPEKLIMYDAFAISGEAAKGLDYKVYLTGATVR